MSDSNAAILFMISAGVIFYLYYNAQQRKATSKETYSDSDHLQLQFITGSIPNSYRPPSNDTRRDGLTINTDL
jgi:hypothetical protein